MCITSGGWKGADDADVDVCEWVHGNWDVLSGRTVMEMYLVALAMLALTGPSGDVSAHPVPHEMGANEALDSADTRVEEVVESVEHLAMELCGHHQLGLAAGHIAEHHGEAKAGADIQQAEAGGCRV